MRRSMDVMKGFIELTAIVAGVVAGYAAVACVVIGVPCLVILGLLRLFGVI